MRLLGSDRNAMRLLGSDRNAMHLLGSDRDAMRRIALSESFNAKFVIIVKMMKDSFALLKGESGRTEPGAGRDWYKS